MINRILLKILCIVGVVYINRLKVEYQRKDGAIMKGKFVVKGLKCNVEINEAVKKYDADHVTLEVIPTKIASLELGLEETNDEIEMDQEEFKHVYTTVKEDLANLREVVIVPLMEKVFTLADNLTLLANKKVESDIKIAEFTAGVTAPAPAEPAAE